MHNYVCGLTFYWINHSLHLHSLMNFWHNVVDNILVNHWFILLLNNGIWMQRKSVSKTVEHFTHLPVPTFIFSWDFLSLLLFIPYNLDLSFNLFLLNATVLKRRQGPCVALFIDNTLVVNRNLVERMITIRMGGKRWTWKNKLKHLHCINNEAKKKTPYGFLGESVRSVV